jgi:hypothetical protein
VVSISGAKGKKLIQAQQWKSKPYRQARAERSAMESLVFTLKESFEFGELVRRTHENVLAEMLEKCWPTISLRSCGCGRSFQSPKRRNGQQLDLPITLSPRWSKTAEPCLAQSNKEWQRQAKSKVNALKGAAAQKLSPPRHPPVHNRKSVTPFRRPSS